MHVYNLRFGAATTPHQKIIYDQLYPMLDDVRDRVTKESESAQPPRSIRANARGRLLQQAGSRSIDGKPKKDVPGRPIPNSEKSLRSGSQPLIERGPA